MTTKLEATEARAASAEAMAHFHQTRSEMVLRAEAESRTRLAAAEAELEHLRSMYTHQHAIAGEQLTRALTAEAENRHLVEKLAAAKAEAEQGFRVFEFAVRLLGYAEREKRLAHGEERAYWQGACDACRKLTNVYRGEGGFMDLFEAALNPAKPAGEE